MPIANRPRRRTIPPIVAAVVQPVAKRLARMEALLIEMRHEQDVKLKRISALQEQVATLTENVALNSKNIRRLSLRRE
jgi:hypothetical protein